jgi:hypothetical protein
MAKEKVQNKVDNPMAKEKVQNKGQAIQWPKKKYKIKYRQFNDQRKSRIVCPLFCTFSLAIGLSTLFCTFSLAIGLSVLYFMLFL